MNTKQIIIIVVIAIAVIRLLTYIIGKRNKFVNLKAEVENLLSNISVQKEARSRAIVDAMEILGVAHSNDVSAIKGLNIDAQSKELVACAQKYPDLKATPAYASALSRIQNFNEDIASADSLLNKAIKEYNQAIAVFPANIVAGMFGFAKETYIDDENMGSNKNLNIERVDYSKYRN